jgi:hypothetical protein
VLQAANKVSINIVGKIIFFMLTMSVYNCQK